MIPGTYILIPGIVMLGLVPICGGLWWLLGRKASAAPEHKEDRIRLDSQLFAFGGAILLILGVDLVVLGYMNPYVGFASVTIDNPLFVIIALFVGIWWPLCTQISEPDECCDERMAVVRTLTIGAIALSLVGYAILAHFISHLRGGLFWVFIGWCGVVYVIISALVFKPWERIYQPAKSR